MSIKNKFVLFVLGPLLIYVLWYSYWGRMRHYEQLRHTGKHTIGTVTHIGLKVYHVVITVNGRVHTIVQSRPSPPVYESEEYEVIYNQENPKDAIVLLSKPFLDTLNLHFSQTIPEHVEETSPSSIITFSYRVNGEVYERSQRIISRPEINSAARNLVVMYRIGRPEIGYVVVRR